MSDPTTAQPVENVSRGSIFSLVVIPVAIIASALLGSFLGIASGIVGLVVAYLSGWLYSKGAGGPFDGKMVGAAGRLPFILITAVAVILGAITSIVSAVYSGFAAVGGDGGLFGSAFGTTLARALSNGGDFFFPIVLSLVFGAVGIVSVIRGPKATTTAAQQQAAYRGQPGYPVQPSQTAGYPTSEQTAASAAPSIPTAPPITPPNQSSPGIILNGKPIDPSKQ